MLGRGAAAGINHLLAQQGWARQKLAPFAGQHVAFRCPPFPDLHLEILESGLVQPAAPEPAAALSVTLRPDLLPRLLMRDESAIAQAAFEGSSELADTVQFLFRNLAWDAGEDLARVFGDVLAQRMTATGEALLAWQREAAQRLGANFAEYFTEEQPVLVTKAAVRSLAAEVGLALEAVDRLERRIAQLERGTRS